MDRQIPTEESLMIEAQCAALKESAGAWTDQNHPDMATEADIDRWLDNLRKTWMRMDVDADNLTNPYGSS